MRGPAPRISKSGSLIRDVQIFRCSDVQSRVLEEDLVPHAVRGRFMNINVLD